MGVLAGCLLLVLGLFPSPGSATRLPSANRECATCHIMWLTEFKRKDVVPLIPYEPQPTVDTGKQDVASTERMCFSCHDGFVLDSRFLWKNRQHTHPVGVKPPSGMEFPTIGGKTLFPLNKDGKVYCGTCHSAHGVDWKQEESTIFLRMNNDESRLCMACHIDKTGGPEHGSHPLFKKPERIPPALRKAGSRFARDDTLICQSCHRVHGSSSERLLVVDNTRSGLCAQCHSDKAAVVGSKHDLSLMAPQVLNTLGGKPQVKGPCSACHVPHKADRWRLWARPRDGKADPVSDACLGCHREDGPAHKKTIGHISHPVGKTLDALGIQATLTRWFDKLGRKTPFGPLQPLPLFDRQGQHAARGGRLSCATCHDPHRWSAAAGGLPPGDPRKLEGDGNSSFLRIANGGDSRLCVNCHRDQSVVALSKHNLNISGSEARNVAGQGVTQSGMCGACHQPHKGTGIRLWARSLEQVPGAGIEPLCLSCHRDGAPAKEKQPGRHSHPLHLDLRRIGANTRLPLYLKNGHPDDQKGGIDCTTCHNPHQWQPGNPLGRAGADAGVEGDARTSFLRLPAAHQPELCLDCHLDKRPVLGTEHDLFVTAPDARNALGQTVAESGECGACHRVHQARLGLRLWAREAATTGDAAADLCLGCHRGEGVAKAKVPEKWEHPPRPVTPVGGLLSVLPPVFGDDGRPDDTGRITCPTCHDPHQWKPGDPRRGPGKNREGSVLDSFLRVDDSTHFLCSYCHGEDSLFRYKYFHWEKSREKHHLYKP